jgi:hypothetical protein
MGIVPNVILNDENGSKYPVPHALNKSLVLCMMTASHPKKNSFLSFTLNNIRHRIEKNNAHKGVRKMECVMPRCHI